MNFKLGQASLTALALAFLPACEKKNSTSPTPNTKTSISSTSLPPSGFNFTRDPNYIAWRKLQISPTSPDFNARISKVKSAIINFVPTVAAEQTLQDKLTPERAAAWILTVSAHQNNTSKALNSIASTIDPKLLTPKCSLDDPNRNTIFFRHAYELGKTFLSEPNYSKIILQHFGQDELDCLEINSSMLIAQQMLVNPYLKVGEKITLAPTFGMIVDDRLFKNGGQHISIGASFTPNIEQYYDASMLNLPNQVNQISAQDPRWIAIAGYYLVMTKKEDRIKIDRSEPQLFCIPEYSSS